MRLHISKDIALPTDAITQTFGILGKRGSGKTTTASVFAEELLRKGLPLVVVDPTGAWWGLRSGKDGKKGGFPITILGGDHGDVLLEEAAGKVIADLVAEEAPPLVLDLSSLSKNAMRRFMTDFAEELYKKNRNAISVILDEADMFAPQRIFKGGERLFGAIDEIVRRGRIRGLGVVMVSQRSAAINKDILSQCEVVIAHRANHPRDIEPVMEWMRVHATKDQLEEVHATIAQLADGEAWVMSPEWLDFFGRVQIRDRTTFNSSATPKAGERRISPRHLAEVDLELLQQRMADTIERAKENDPAILKKRIRELEHQVKNTPEPTMPYTTIMGIMEEGREEGRAEMREVLQQSNVQIERSRAIMREAAALLQSIDDMLPIKTDGEPPMPGESASPSVSSILNRRHSTLPPPSTSPNQSITLRHGARRMLAALVQWAPQGMTEGQMRTHAALKKSGTYSAYKTDLRKAGFIEERGGLFYATDAGINWIGHDIPAPGTTQGVLEVWLPKLRLGARRMLEVLIECGGSFITDTELQERAGLAKSGTFGAYKTDLRTAGLVITENGMIAANKEVLFL